MRLLLLLVTVASANPEGTLDVPVEQSHARVPAAVQQRYLSRAVNEAVGELDFGPIRGHSVRLETAGVLQMTDRDLGEYVRQAITSQIAVQGGRVVSESGETVLARIGEAGIDRVLERQRVKVARSKGGPAALMISGGGAAMIGAMAMALGSGHPDTQNAGMGVTVVGGLVFGGGVALLYLPPKVGAIRCPVYRARVRIDATFVPDTGAAYETSGNADILVNESTSPCANVDANGFLIDGHAAAEE